MTEELALLKDGPASQPQGADMQAFVEVRAVDRRTAGEAGIFSLK